MMRKRLFALLATITLLALIIPNYAFADELVFTKGKQLELFDENGIRLYLTGNVKDTGMLFMELETVIENNTDDHIKLVYYGSANGWTIMKTTAVGAYVNAHTKSKSSLVFNYNDLSLGRYEDLQNAQFSFVIEKNDPSQASKGFIDLTGSDPDSVLFTVDDIQIRFGDYGAARKMVYYTDVSPSMPTPDSYVNVKEKRHSASKVNGKVKKAVYTYGTKNNSDNIDEIFSNYINGLKNSGYKVSGSGKKFTVSNGSKKLATVTLTSSTFEVDINPGNEKLTKKP